MCRIRLDERIGSFPLILGARRLLSEFISLAKEDETYDQGGKNVEEGNEPFWGCRWYQVHSSREDDHV
jgi:hypothetical protein